MKKVACRIGILYSDGSIRSVRCESAGQPGTTGDLILRAWYHSQDDRIIPNATERAELNHGHAENMIRGGDMQELGNNEYTSVRTSGAAQPVA